MTPRLLAASSLLAFVLIACGPQAMSRIDGGVANCDQGEAQTRALPVEVVDAQGNPVEGATVTAKNVGSGQTVTATTGSNGRTTAITSAIGAGTIQVSAQKGSQVSDVKQSEALCGECGCTFTPDSLTLTMNP
ncbi:MAG: carboxypeptidase regulatory-like domain-containing protein [Myxococcaceae bacterium]|nr:carboxypeptidase regulatory-like domain-containing protein [Myxococcaceae bacterium]